MCDYARAAGRDPLVGALAVRACNTFKGGPAWAGSPDGWTHQRMRESCWWWAKWNLKFRHHGSMFEAWSSDLGDPQTKLQLLIAPDVLVRMTRMEGDCAIYTMMVCSMLESLGLPWEIVTLAVDARQPDIFSHVCARSEGETLDASHGPRPGWQVPAGDTFREWVFDSSGRRISSAGRPGGKFSGLHAYRGRGRGMWGLGEYVCDEGGCYDNGAAASVPGTTGGYYNPTQVFGSDVGYQGNWSELPSGSISIPSQNSAAWASVATQLTKMGMTLAQMNALRPGMVVRPDGTVLQQNPGYAVPIGQQISNAFGGGSSLLYIGGGLVALFLVGSMFKGRR
jgi:hypothetical protein